METDNSELQKLGTGQPIDPKKLYEQMAEDSQDRLLFQTKAAKPVGHNDEQKPGPF